ncbi:MAG: isoprenylcysteine carboxylmethyltransferase family protein [Betaproteobacteria bacterium]|nr:isoprenylcysteine carboxylmethyltransferase family protein [Betaproteobacteria bacterium]
MMAFLAGTAANIWLSWRSLRVPGTHGFYRFFALEAILGLFILNHEPWGQNPDSLHQFFARLLMLLSLTLVCLGLLQLKRAGRVAEERDDATLYTFEKTTRLVTSGIYAHIRHPMYASLLALAWGAYLHAPSLAGSLLAAFASLCLWLTALADERECLAYFGAEYANYMRRTRRFIPGLY